MLNNTTLIDPSNTTPDNSVALIISGYIYNLLQTHDTLFTLFALIGMYTVARMLFSMGSQFGTEMIKLFVFTPIILISEILNARKDIKKKQELNEIIPYILKTTVFWSVLLLCFMCVVAYFVLQPEIHIMTDTSQNIIDIANATTNLTNNTTATATFNIR